MRLMFCPISNVLKHVKFIPESKSHLQTCEQVPVLQTLQLCTETNGKEIIKIIALKLLIKNPQQINAPPKDFCVVYL